jgi:hypothetical protein
MYGRGSWEYRITKTRARVTNAGLVYQIGAHDPGPVIVDLVASHQGAKPPAGPDLVQDLLATIRTG